MAAMTSVELGKYYKDFVTQVQSLVEEKLPSFYFSDTYWSNYRLHCRYEAATFVYDFSENKIIINKANNVIPIKITIETGQMPAGKGQSAYHVVYLEPKMGLSGTNGWIYPYINQGNADMIMDIVGASKFNFFSASAKIDGNTVVVNISHDHKEPQRNWKPLYIFLDRPFSLPAANQAVQDLLGDWLEKRVDDFNDIAAMFESIESLY